MIPFNWYLTNTGGGCTAERADLPDGRYALLTDDDTFLRAPSRQTRRFLIGLYNADDEQIGDCADGSREECEAWLAERITK